MARFNGANLVLHELGADFQADFLVQESDDLTTSI